MGLRACGAVARRFCETRRSTRPGTGGTLGQTARETVERAGQNPASRRPRRLRRTALPEVAGRRRPDRRRYSVLPNPDDTLRTLPVSARNAIRRAFSHQERLRAPRAAASRASLRSLGPDAQDRRLRAGSRSEMGSRPLRRCRQHVDGIWRNGQHEDSSERHLRRVPRWRLRCVVHGAVQCRQNSPDRTEPASVSLGTGHRHALPRPGLLPAGRSDPGVPAVAHRPASEPRRTTCRRKYSIGSASITSPRSEPGSRETARVCCGAMPATIPLSTISPRSRCSIRTAANMPASSC